MPPIENNIAYGESRVETPLTGSSLSLLAVSSHKSFSEEAKETLGPGASAVCTRAAVLGLTGRLHTSFSSIERTLNAIDSPLGSQFSNRLADMRSNGWRFERVAPRDIGNAGGMYLPESRELLYTRPSSIPYILGLTSEHPSASATSIVAHELGHHDGIRSHPESRLSGTSQLRTMAYRTLASETNAIVAQIQVEGALKADVFSGPYRSALLNNTLGGQIFRDWSRSVPAFQSISEAEANTFVNDYIRNRWGPEIVDARTGNLRFLSLEPGGAPFEGEPLPQDAELASRADDYRSRRVEANSENRLLRLSRACQSRIGSSAIHGLKVTGALGACVMANSIYSGFNESVGSGFGETARAGVGFAGFELGTGAV
ncbi:MAG: hypothetical protein K2Z81_01340, partial [Cyanobacteria bacterium]|nr:hypothetical protein [Cyanobacteriota bacterium]